jgi:small subunit ribosomal protein S3
MGRKTNPNILRVGNILRSWDSKWFTSRRSDFRKQLATDLFIRRYFATKLRSASVAKIEIAWEQNDIVLTLHTSRPAVVIGRGGSGITKIQSDMKSLLPGQPRVRINVQEVRNPDTDAVAVATQIIEQIERRMPYRRIMKQAVSRSMQAGALGIRVALAGRLNGAEIARREWLAEGNVPLHTFRSNISFAKKTAFTTYGTIGVKVWINRGDLLPEEEKPGQKRESRSRKQRTARRRPSLAAKANTAR